MDEIITFKCNICDFESQDKSVITTCESQGKQVKYKIEQKVLIDINGDATSAEIKYLIFEQKNPHPYIFCGNKFL